MLNNDVLIPSL